MTSAKQIEANRLNAQRSTGPRTLTGKRRSRRNAIRHGLTAETVIGVLEDPHDYRAFEQAVVREYAPRGMVEKQLVLRMASLLWRLRRAIAIETGLLHIQADILNSRKNSKTSPQTVTVAGGDLVGRLLGAVTPDAAGMIWTGAGSRLLERQGVYVRERPEQAGAADPSKAIARCFLRMANLENELLERVGRYEAALWRQFAKTLTVLLGLRRATSSGRYGGCGTTAAADR